MLLQAEVEQTNVQYYDKSTLGTYYTNIFQTLNFISCS